MLKLKDYKVFIPPIPVRLQSALGPLGSHAHRYVVGDCWKKLASTTFDGEGLTGRGGPDGPEG